MKEETKVIKHLLSTLYDKTGFMVKFTNNKFTAKGIKLELVRVCDHTDEDEWSLFDGDDLIIACQPLKRIVAAACAELYSSYIHVVVAS